MGTLWIDAFGEMCITSHADKSVAVLEFKPYSIFGSHDVGYVEVCVLILVFSLGNQCGVPQPDPRFCAHIPTILGYNPMLLLTGRGLYQQGQEDD